MIRVSEKQLEFIPADPVAEVDENETKKETQKEKDIESIKSIHSDGTRKA